MLVLNVEVYACTGTTDATLDGQCKFDCVEIIRNHLKFWILVSSLKTK